MTRLAGLSIISVASIVMLSGASINAATEPRTSGNGEVVVTPSEQLGKSIFFDANLSSKRNQSCAFCHAPETGFSSPRDDFNRTGGVVEGAIEGRFGNAKPPTAAYVFHGPPLHHKYEKNDEGKPELLFVGGAFYNGRATGSKLGNIAADQAQGPFLNPVEMALPDSACVVSRACNPVNPDAYPVTVADVWGAKTCKIDLPDDLDDLCGNPEAKIELSEETREKVEEAYDKIALSIGAYEGSREVSPFSSKYDADLAGEAELTEQERLGLELFGGDKAKCSQCHVLDPSPRGEPTLGTDFTYDNLGVPRNPDNPFYTNAAFNTQGSKWVENGLEFTLAKDPLYKSLASSQRGKVRVPTVRNVDKRPTADFVKSYMHNGYFKSLWSVVDFYNTRDAKPRCKNPLTREADALRLNCWPEPEVLENVNIDEMGDLKLTRVEEEAIVAFMKALSDGYTPDR